MRLARNRDGLERVENLRGFLFSVLRNEAFRHRSRWRRWWHGDLAAGITRLAEEAAGDRQAQGETEAIEQAMARLPPAQREVVFLKVWQGMTFAEIARLLAISPNTAASAYRYGLSKLKGMLEHER